MHAVYSIVYAVAILVVSAHPARFFSSRHSPRPDRFHHHPLFSGPGKSKGGLNVGTLNHTPGQR